MDDLSMLIAVLECIEDWYMRSLIDEDVNHKDITHLWLTTICVWLLECLSMYVNYHFHQWLMTV